MYIEHFDVKHPLLSAYLSVDEKIPLMVEELTVLALSIKSLKQGLGVNKQVVFCVEMGEQWGDLANKLVGRSNPLSVYQIEEMTDTDPFLKGICSSELYQTALEYKPDFDPFLLDNLQEREILGIIFSRDNIRLIHFNTQEKNKLI